MNRNEVITVLTTLSQFDNRTLTPEMVDTWHGKRTIQNLDFRVAMIAVDILTDEAATGPNVRTYIDVHQFWRGVKLAKRRLEQAEAKARAKSFAITARPEPNPVPWRERMARLGHTVTHEAPRIVEKHPTQSIPVITTSIPVIQPDAVRRDMSTFLDGFGRLA